MREEKLKVMLMEANYFGQFVGFAVASIVYLADWVGLVAIPIGWLLAKFYVNKMML